MPHLAAKGGRADSTLRRAQSGDRAARHELVLAHQNSVFRLVARVLETGGLAHLAEDAAQDTFLKAFRSLHRFDVDGPAKFSTWLATIATRVAIDLLKRPRRAIEPAHSVELVEAQGADTLERQQRLAQAVVDAVAELPPAYRAAFVLIEYDGISPDEVAEMLDLTPGTLRSRLSKARTRIRRRLKDLRDDRQR